MSCGAEAAAAVSAVRAALTVVQERSGAHHIMAKGGLDMATGTDIGSQRVIERTLARAHPEHAFVGEESHQDEMPVTGSYWLVDPICGTRNFASRLPLYAINVALIEGGRVVVAAVGDGAHGEVYVAQRDLGSWREESGTLSPIGSSDRSAIVSIDRGRHDPAVAEKAARVMGGAIRSDRWELRTLGSSLDLAYLAEGRIAGVWHFSRIAPLHFAAGTLLATEAGALLTDDRGMPWALTSDSLVAAGSPALHRELLALL